MSVRELADSSRWLSLFARYGYGQPFKWGLTDVVQPVTLVDSIVTLSAVAVQPLYGTPFTAGEQVNPAGGTRLADTGALAVGNWTFTVLMGGSVAMDFRIRRRNAADAADIWSHRTWTAVNSGLNALTIRLSMSANERLVVENVPAGGAGNTYQCTIFALAG
jgi:hypothetical protein